jgi:hypothetical protein
MRIEAFSMQSKMKALLSTDAMYSWKKPQIRRCEFWLQKSPVAQLIIQVQSDYSKESPFLRPIRRGCWWEDARSGFALGTLKNVAAHRNGFVELSYFAPTA